MSLKQIMVNATSDGMYFSDKDEALQHEFTLQRKTVIAYFMSQAVAQEYTERGRASAKRILEDFCNILYRNEVTLPWQEGPSVEQLALNQVREAKKRLEAFAELMRTVKAVYPAEVDTEGGAGK